MTKIQLIDEQEKTLRKIFDKDHTYDWSVKIDDWQYKLIGCRGDASIHEVIELVAKFLQAEAYESERITAEHS